MPAVKMASRALVLRDALNERLIEYLKEVSEDDFDNFLDEQRASLTKRLEDNQDGCKRLKDW